MSNPAAHGLLLDTERWHTSAGDYVRKLRYRYRPAGFPGCICSKMGLEPTDTGQVTWQDLRMPCFWLCWARQHWQLVVQVTGGSSQGEPVGVVSGQHRLPASWYVYPACNA